MSKHFKETPILSSVRLFSAKQVRGNRGQVWQHRPGAGRGRLRARHYSQIPQIQVGYRLYELKRCSNTN